MPGLQMLVEELTCTASIARSKYLTCKDGVVMTDHLGNIFWDSIINRWLVEAFSSSSYVNWIEWMDNYVCVVGLDRIG